MRIFFLDDNESRCASFLRVVAMRRPEWCVTVSRTPEHAKDTLRNSQAFDIISLDHDLGFPDGGPDGTDIARFITDENIGYGRAIIHSANPDGANRMAGILARAEIIPFMCLFDRMLKKEAV